MTRAPTKPPATERRRARRGTKPPTPQRRATPTTPPLRTSRARRFVSVIVRPGASASRSDRDANQPTTNANFQARSDSQGFQWDIDQFGRINDGTNDCFDGGQYLKLDNQQFSGSVNQMTQDGQEYILTNNMQGLQVTRRIWVDTTRGGARYIETFHNPTNKRIDTRVAIYSMLGSNAQATATTANQQFNGGELPAGTTGVMAISNSQRPSVLWVLADQNETDRPTINIGSNREYTFTWALQVEPRQTISLVHFVAQRNGGAVGNVSDQLEPFYKNNRLIDPQIPDDLKPTVINFRIRQGVRGEAVLTPVTELAIERDVERGERDVLMFPDGTRLTGDAQGPTLRVKNAMGEVDVPWEDVALLAGAAGDEGTPARVYLRSGEMLSGEVTSQEPITMKSTNGLDVALEPRQIDLLFTKITDADNVRSEGAQALLQLQDGQRVGISGGDEGGEPVELHAVTPWGPLDVGLEDVAYLEQVREPQPGHRLVLQDGSQLTVVLRSGELPMRTVRFGAAPLSVFDVQMIARLRDVALDDDDATLPIDGMDEGGEPVKVLSPEDQARITALQAQLRQLHAIRAASQKQADEARAAGDEARAQTFERRAGSLDGQIERATGTLKEMGVEPASPEADPQPEGTADNPDGEDPAANPDNPAPSGDGGPGDDPAATQPADPDSDSDEEAAKENGFHFNLAGENLIIGRFGVEELDVVNALGTTSVDVERITRMERITDDRVDPVFIIEMGEDTSIEGRLRLRYLPVSSEYRDWEIPTAHLVSFETPEGERAANARAAAADRESQPIIK